MTRYPGRPFANTRLAKYLAKRVLELKSTKTQATIATEAGFPNTNMLSMLKNGSNKLPLDRVPGLARGLDCDPAFLFLLALNQVFGNAAEVTIKQIFGTLPTRNEVAWLEEIRGASEHSDPHMTAKAQKAIRGIFGK